MSSQQMYENNRDSQYGEGYGRENKFDQERQFDGRYERRDSLDDRYERGYPLDNRFGQKIYPEGSQSQQGVTARQRMIVAIVSVCILVPLTVIILTTNVSDQTAGNPAIIISRLITLAVVCLAIMVVNLALGWKR